MGRSFGCHFCGKEEQVYAVQFSIAKSPENPLTAGLRLNNFRPQSLGRERVKRPPTLSFSNER